MHLYESAFLWPILLCCLVRNKLIDWLIEFFLWPQSTSDRLQCPLHGCPRLSNKQLDNVVVDVVVHADNEDRVCAKTRRDCHSLLCVLRRTRRLRQDHYRQNSRLNRILRCPGNHQLSVYRPILWSLPAVRLKHYPRTVLIVLGISVASCWGARDRALSTSNNFYRVMLRKERWCDSNLSVCLWRSGMIFAQVGILRK